MASAKGAMKGWTVSIETWGDGVASVDDELLMELGPTISSFGGLGAAAGAGGLAGGVSATFTVGAGSMSGHDADVLAAAMHEAVSIFEAACVKLGLAHVGIARVDVMDGTYADRELEREPESYLGVSELAARVGVSRQRISELRARADFPAPVAELAAGPVWAASSLQRFLDMWPRKPGRPLNRVSSGHIDGSA